MHTRHHERTLPYIVQLYIFDLAQELKQAAAVSGSGEDGEANKE